MASAITARLTSLRITGGNGSGNNSGGVFVTNRNANVTIKDCVLIENTRYYGGGVFVFN